jgi:hypothetical protein
MRSNTGSSLRNLGKQSYSSLSTFCSVLSLPSAFFFLVTLFLEKLPMLTHKSNPKTWVNMVYLSFGRRLLCYIPVVNIFYSFIHSFIHATDTY